VGRKLLTPASATGGCQIWVSSLASVNGNIHWWHHVYTFPAVDASRESGHEADAQWNMGFGLQVLWCVLAGQLGWLVGGGLGPQVNNDT